MELEEMKTKWMLMSAEMEKQKKLTDILIIKMTKSDYRRKIDRIRIPELIGSAVCAAQVIYILANFQAFNNWYLMTCGILSVFILIVLPVLSIRAISKMSSLSLAAKEYKELLFEYSQAKLDFIRVQKISFILGFVLMITLFPVALRLAAGKEILFQPKWLIFYAVGAPLFYLFAIRVFRSYKKSANDAGVVLQELDRE